jgi:Tfp pilus assembly protein PilF
MRNTWLAAVAALKKKLPAMPACIVLIALAVSGSVEAWADDPNTAQAVGARATAEFSQGNYAAAIADFSAFIQLVPNSEPAYYNRGVTYFRQGNYAAALADLNTALRMNPNDALAYSARGMIYGSQGNYAAALADFNSALRIDPQLQLASRHRASILQILAKRQQEQAAASQQQAAAGGGNAGDNGAKGLPPNVAVNTVMNAPLGVPSCISIQKAGTRWNSPKAAIDPQVVTTVRMTNTCGKDVLLLARYSADGMGWSDPAWSGGAMLFTGGALRSWPVGPARPVLPFPATDRDMVYPFHPGTVEAEIIHGAAKVYGPINFKLAYCPRLTTVDGAQRINVFFHQAPADGVGRFSCVPLPKGY